MLAEQYDELYTNDPERWSDIRHDEMVFNHVSGYGEPASLLEIGCGNGHTLEYFAENWPGVDYVGLDFSTVAIDISKAKVPGAEFVCIDIMEYKPLGKFEMILLVGVAEHFDDPLGKLEYIRQKLLKGNGVMYMEVPNCMAYTKAPKEEGFHKILHGTQQMEWHYKRETWTQIINDAGFEIVKTIRGPRKHNEFIWILSR